MESQWRALNSRAQVRTTAVGKWSYLLRQHGLQRSLPNSQRGGEGKIVLVWHWVPPHLVSCVRRLLWQHGVETESLYEPLHRRGLGQFLAPVDLPNTEALSSRTFAVPTASVLTPSGESRVEAGLHAVERLLSQSLPEYRA